MSNIVTLFDGDIYELVEAVKQAKKRAQKHAIDYIMDFYDNRCTFETAIDRLLNGDADVYARFESATKDVLHRTFETPNYMPDVEGLFINMDAVLLGLPEQWFSEYQEPSPGAAQDIYINVSASGNTPEKNFYDKLVQVVQFIDSREAAGQRMNIYITMCATGTTHGVQERVTVKIKDAAQYINMQHVCTLGATSILLRFAVFMLRAAKYKDFSFGDYYTETKSEEKLKKELAGHVYIPSFYYDSAMGVSNYKKVDIMAKYGLND